ncbi:MAG TPA: AraC family transcriptional regulator [Polyangiaceae bacterium]|nr:AraC family transcriptional regulator [Polyangiaceae bacterium]
MTQRANPNLPARPRAALAKRAERSQTLAQGPPAADRRAVTDTLSDVLRAVRLTGAVFFAIDASNPWVTEAPPASAIAPHIMPGVEHVIEYHVVKSGSCWGGIVGEPAVLLEAGDVIVFPQGDAHVISSAPGMRATLDLTPHERASRSPLPIAISIDGGGSERAQMICGFLGCDARPFNPLLATLPRVIHLRGTGENGSVLRHLVELAVAESGAPKAGSDCILSRLSELLFIEVVRRYVAALPTETVGWFAGLRDEQIGRALQKLHQKPAHPWSLEELAKEVGMSRSMLAERFTYFVGVPPIQYLAQWRIQLTAGLLRSNNSGLAEIAERVGYGSEAALSRAFKRWVGVAPAVYRRGTGDSGSGFR